MSLIWHQTLLDSEAPGFKIQERWNNFSLQLLPVQLCPEEIVPFSIPSMS